QASASDAIPSFNPVSFKHSLWSSFTPSCWSNFSPPLTLNDPFELWAVSQPNKQLRKGLRDWKRTMSERYGLLCFSRSWHNPLLWSHYGDRHRGMALGFDIRDELLRPVDYVDKRPSFKNANQATAKGLLFTKFSGWQYEEESRIYTRLEERDPVSHLHFAEFSDDLVLQEVIAGPLCTESKQIIRSSLEGYAYRVRLIKSRLAFKTFRVVKDQKGF
ncbi:MAG TPA: DUF2971 domain-containing protein, partial [Candidatus Angelobacter sp.]|nr:DUF2971 domain-containing protein [Candidatus Angelobacter sp.]